MYYIVGIGNLGNLPQKFYYHDNGVFTFKFKSETKKYDSEKKALEFIRDKERDLIRSFENIVEANFAGVEYKLSDIQLKVEKI